MNPVATFLAAIAAAADTPDLLRLQNVELPALPVTENERAGLKDQLRRRFVALTAFPPVKNRPSPAQRQAPSPIGKNCR